MNAHEQIRISSNIEPEPVSFRSGEYKLNGELFHPTQPPQAIVVINPATGVKASFYAEFAEWLCDNHGFAVLLYDYRDFGASAVGHVKTSKATMADWGVHDAQAARDFAAVRFPNSPLLVIGHSLGGLCLPFQTGLNRIARVITVCSGPVHTTDHPWPYQAKARLFWHGPVPLLASVVGYLPGKRLGVGPDLPIGVYKQWRKWCTSRSFFFDDFGTHLPYPDWRGLNAPIKFVAVSDDALVPASAVWRLMRCYPDAPKSQSVLRPSDFDLTDIGHIGVFSARSRATWNALIA